MFFKHVSNRIKILLFWNVERIANYKWDIKIPPMKMALLQRDGFVD